MEENLGVGDAAVVWSGGVWSVRDISLRGRTRRTRERGEHVYIWVGWGSDGGQGSVDVGVGGGRGCGAQRVPGWRAGGDFSADGYAVECSRDACAASGWARVSGGQGHRNRVRVTADIATHPNGEARRRLEWDGDFCFDLNWFSIHKSWLVAPLAGVFQGCGMQGLRAGDRRCGLDSSVGANQSLDAHN